MIQEHDCIVLTQDIPEEGLRAGDVGIELVNADEKVPSGAAGTVVYWCTQNFDKRLDYLLSIGAQPFRGPIKIEGDCRICQVKDPFGNPIGIREFNGDQQDDTNS